MSTAPTSSAHASTAAAPTPHGKARHGAAPEGGSDLFANLLSLLNATSDPAMEITLGTGTGTGTDTEAGEPVDARHAQDSATDSSQNPLAALLGWTTGMPGMPIAPMAGTATAIPSAATTASPFAPSISDATLPSSVPTLTGLADAAAVSSPTLPVATSASVAQPAKPSLSLQGMTPLTTPAAPDAQTLAALAQATSNSAPAEAPRAVPTAADAASVAAVASDSAPSTPRSLHWRSTVGAVSAVATQALQAGHQNALGESAAGLRQALAAQSRSTVALDDRFGQTPATTPTPLIAEGSAPVAATGSSAQHQDSGSGSPGGTPGQGGLETSSGSPAANTPEASAYAEATRGLDDSSAAHWGTPNLRHASLRVGEGTEDAIDIQLSLSGQEVQVDFRTDNAEARASLAQDAGGSLGELLQRSGIQLGSVSVGAQNQQQGEPGRPHVLTPAQTRSRTAEGSETTAIKAPTVQRPRSDGSRPLDLFV